MTVKELKAQLNDLPDAAYVMVYTTDGPGEESLGAVEYSEEYVYLMGISATALTD